MALGADDRHGGSFGGEWPIVPIGSTLGSTAGQWLKLSARDIKLLVAAGATSEFILRSFAVESLTPIVLASVISDFVQQHIGAHRLDPILKTGVSVQRAQAGESA